MLFCVLAVVGLAADQASKYYMFSSLRDVPRHEQAVIPGVFHLVANHELNEQGELVPYVNRGALFGWLQGLGMKANTGFAVISLIAAIAILIWIAQRSTATDRVLCIALGLILGGTLGNFYDRLTFGGVRDFLYWKMPEWPVFNIADCCLVIGAGLLLIQAFRPAPKSEQVKDDLSVRVTQPAEARV
jgi:lipoprotein signal peptidase